MVSWIELPMPNRTEVTLLLERIRGGDRSAVDDLMPLVYNELRGLASRYLNNERAGHTLQTTALVHEAYVRLFDTDVSWKDRTHFYAMAARLMRRILVDHAKGQRRAKRGGGAPRVNLDEAVALSPEPRPDLVELDEVLSRLGALDARKSQIVELHFFGGLTYDETAEALGLSAATVHRELRLAKAWLHRELSGGPGGGP